MLNYETLPREKQLDSLLNMGIEVESLLCHIVDSQTIHQAEERAVESCQYVRHGSGTGLVSILP